MKRNSIYVILAVTVALTQASCQKEEMVNRLGMSDDTIKYAVSMWEFSQTRGTVGSASSTVMLTGVGDSLSIPMEWTVTDGIGISPAPDGTKGTLVNTTGDDNMALSEFASLIGNTFEARAFDGEGTEKVSQTVTWSTANSAWEAAPETKWPKGTSLDFLACANLPSGQTASISSAGVSTAHTVPATANAQTDILFGHYRGDGGTTGTAEIRFEHPLTSVRFLYGMMSELVVRSIALEGVAQIGNVTMAVDGTVNWSDVGSYTHTVSQAKEGGLDKTVIAGYTNKLIGEPFIIIPQDLSDNSVKVKVTFTDNSEVETEIKTGQWKAGSVNTYTLGYDIYTYEYIFTLEDGKDEADLSFINGSEPASKTVGITSKRRRVETEEDFSGGAVVIKSVQVGSSAAQSINDVAFNNIGGLSALVSADSLMLTAAKRTESIRPGSHDNWTGGQGDWSPADWTSETATSPIDLSLFDPYTDCTRTDGMTTANCYIIRHAGTYKLPLVYGNAVRGGSEYVDAYEPSMAAGGDEDHFLSPFLNHRGAGITSAFIENNDNCIASSAEILWQDKATVIKGLNIVSGATTGSAGSYNSDNVRYLQFTVDNNTVCQNNAVIAVKDAGGNIIWSWHIWTTNDPTLLSGPITITNHASNEYNFFALNLLGWIDGVCIPARSDIKIILEQKESGNEIEITVHQPTSAPEGTACYYQWGRKDPMPGTDLNYGTIPYRRNEGTTIAESILNPATFFIGSNSNYDWLYSDHYYNLWTGKTTTTDYCEQNENMIKTIYDPSPVGYKLPASNAFTFMTTTGEHADDVSKYNVEGTLSNGYYFYSKPNRTGELVFFAAAGDRNSKSGKCQDYGEWAWYWSAVPKDNKLGCGMYYWGGHFINPINSNDRSTGNSVRPVQE